MVHACCFYERFLRTFRCNRGACRTAICVCMQDACLLLEHAKIDPSML